MLKQRIVVKAKEVLVIGLGVSGRSAAAFLLQQGAFVTAVDANVELLRSTEVENLRHKGLKTTLESELTELQHFRLVVISPGIPAMNALSMRARAMGIEVIGEIELACRFLQGRFLAITGTNGKTTVTLLVTHVLNQSGIHARSLGNVGTALTSECLADSKEEILVVELSSYQLETMTSQIIDAAVILNITPDHLDRYPNMESYAQAKMQVAHCLKSGAPLYIEQKCFQQFNYLIPCGAPKTYGYDSSCTIFADQANLYANGRIACSLPPLYRGKKSHDLENVMAAYALCQHVGVTPAQFMEAIASFKKPPHRIEFVRTVNGVTFYDDSKGTNIDAVIRAVETLSGDIILICGGVDKGAAYTPWIPVFAHKVKSICAIGQAAEKIKRELSPAIPVELCCSLEDAVLCAAKQAQLGDTVLLSPGCSSYDMFRDYAHRGDVFKRLVHDLVLV